MPIKTVQPENITAGQWTSTFIDSLPDTSFAYIASNGDRYLPYKNSDGDVSLPQVRNALAGLSKITAIPETDKSKVKTKLQTSFKNAQASNDGDDMVLRSIHSIQASDSSSLPTKIMLLRAGTFNTQKYGEVPLSTEDIVEMDVNFHKGLGMADDGQTGIPIDYAHQSHLNAAGWIKDVAVEGDALWGTSIEWSGSGQKALIDKEYKCLSSDFYPSAFGEWVDPESGIVAQNVIVGAALTNRPMFSGNQTVLASDTKESGSGTKTVIYINASQNKEKVNMNIDQLRIKAAEDLTGAEYKYVAENKAQLSADELTKFSLEVTEKEKEVTKPVVKASEVTGDEGVVSIEASELKKIHDSIGVLQANTNAVVRASIKEKVTAYAAEGKIKADRIDSWTDRVMASDDDGRKEIFADLSSLTANPVLAKEQGSSATAGDVQADAEVEVMKKANELVASEKEANRTMDLFTARKQVMASDTDLADRVSGQAKANMQAFGQISKVTD